MRRRCAPIGSSMQLLLVRGHLCQLHGTASGFFLSVTAHLHSQGGGVRVVRFAESGRGVLWENGQSSPKRIRFRAGSDGSWEQAALGVEIHADALHGRVALPSFDASPTPAERTEWMRELVESDPGFPDEMSTFDRSGLADAAEAFAAAWDWSAGPPDDRQFADEMRRVGTVLGLIDPANPGTLSGWIGDADVLRSVLSHVIASRTSQRSDEWLAGMSDASH